MRPAKFSLTALEREVTVDALLSLEKDEDVPPSSRRAALKVIEKIEGSMKPKKAVGLSPVTAVEAFKEVLGNRLLAPLASANGVWGSMGARIKALGLSRGDCVTIAKSAKAEWRNGPIKAESLVRQAESLLAAAQQELPTDVTPAEYESPGVLNEL